MRLHPLLSTCAALSLVLACSRSPDGVGADPEPGEVRRDVARAAEDFGDAAAQAWAKVPHWAELKGDELILAMRAASDRLEPRVAELRERARVKTGEAREASLRLADELEARRAKLEAELEILADSTGDVWQRAKDELIADYQELEAALRQALDGDRSDL
ncbi:MAG TPA: hypothetical protein VMS76_12730 [Planctomycetota bacterium]|nr:hypothetical protein [Planctomycetota bacterium]